MIASIALFTALFTVLRLFIVSSAPCWAPREFQVGSPVTVGKR